MLKTQMNNNTEIIRFIALERAPKNVAQRMLNVISGTKHIVEFL